MKKMTLEELAALVQQSLEHQTDKVMSEIHGVRTDVAGLKTDVAGLKTDVAGLKTDVADLKTDIKRVDGRVDKIYNILDASVGRDKTFELELAALGHKYSRLEEKISESS